jgi:hypothetical protein
VESTPYVGKTARWQVSNPLLETEGKMPRPLALTVLCIVGWLAISVAAGRILVQWEVFSELPAAHVIGAPLALAIPAASLLGYWVMRRWGLWLILLGTLARVGAGIVGVLALRPADLIWPGVIVLFGLAYFRRLK